MQIYRKLYPVFKNISAIYPLAENVSINMKANSIRGFCRLLADAKQKNALHTSVGIHKDDYLFL